MAVLDEVTADPSALATPTSVLIYSGPAHTEAWFRHRQGGITATDLPAILGLSAYRNSLAVWAEKSGELDVADEPGEAALWGLALEEPIAQEWARRNGTTVMQIGVVANVHCTWQRASLDRLVRVCPDREGPCGLEVKCRSAHVAGRWSSDIPDDVLAQVMWQMQVTGYGHMHLAVLIGGNELRQYRVDRDRALIEMLVREGGRLWQHVQDGTPPPVDHDALLRSVLDQLHPNREGLVYLPANTIDALVAERRDAGREYAEASRTLKTAKARIEAADAAIVEALGDGDALAVEGQDTPVITYREVSRNGYTVAPTTFRSVRVAKEYALAGAA